MLSKAALLSLILPAYGAVHESLAALPFGWRESNVALSDDTNVHLQVALQYRNLDSLESKLLSVSTPDSEDYGKYLDKDDVDALFAPSTESVEKVKSWLKKSGVSKITTDGAHVNFDTTVGNANKLLDAKFGLYTNGERTQLGAMQYSVPDELSELIDLVSPTTYFSGMQAHAAVPKAEPVGSPVEARQLKSSCEKTITIEVPVSATKTKNESFTVIGPECLKELYNVGDYTPKANSGSTIAFGSFLNQSASYSDLALFQKIYKLPATNFTILALINGGVNNQDPATEMDGEANLDVQNIIGLVGDLPVGAYITGGSPPFIPDLLQPNATENQNEPYLQYYQYLLSQPNSALPLVITNSYGDEEDTVPEKYAKRVCNMIGMVGMRGISVLESSGDLGVGAVCLSTAGPPGSPKNKPQFTPIFPATCPYITSVGGTQDVNPEHAWVASSGGFSFYFPQPSYQKTAISTYLSKYISSATKDYYSSNKYVDFTGRGFPDVSAHSLTPDYLTVINGTAQPNGGTSAASPTTAAIVALLNDALLRAGKPALGFLNPWLYSKAAPANALNDITKGGSLGCSGVDLQSNTPIKGAGIIKYASWNATTGWDPVTGLGTPNFGKLKTLALS